MLGEKIRQARKSQHLTQKQLGKKLGASLICKGDFESGKQDSKK